MKRGKLLMGDRTLVETVQLAEKLSDRMKGLLGRDSLPPGHALLIRRCGSIHTLFMRFSLDVVFVDKHMRVVRIAGNLKPWRMLFGGWRADAAIEVEAGWLDLVSLRKGDALTLEG